MHAPQGHKAMQDYLLVDLCCSQIAVHFIHGFLLVQTCCSRVDCDTHCCRVEHEHLVMCLCLQQCLKVHHCMCRPRDKIHRPQTRRRRENNEESLDKMRTLRTNLVRAYEVHEWLTRREARKYSLVVSIFHLLCPRPKWLLIRDILRQQGLAHDVPSCTAGLPGSKNLSIVRSGKSLVLVAEVYAR